MIRDENPALIRLLFAHSGANLTPSVTGCLWGSKKEEATFKSARLLLSACSAPCRKERGKKSPEKKGKQPKHEEAVAASCEACCDSCRACRAAERSHTNSHISDILLGLTAVILTLSSRDKPGTKQCWVTPNHVLTAGCMWRKELSVFAIQSRCVS